MEVQGCVLSSGLERPPMILFMLLVRHGTWPFRIRMWRSIGFTNYLKCWVFTRLLCYILNLFYCFDYITKFNFFRMSTFEILSRGQFVLWRTIVLWSNFGTDLLVRLRWITKRLWSCVSIWVSPFCLWFIWWLATVLECRLEPFLPQYFNPCGGR